jgi:hypothetical protein
MPILFSAENSGRHHQPVRRFFLVGGMPSPTLI